MQQSQGVARFKAIQQPVKRTVIIRDAHQTTLNNTGKERTVTKFTPRPVEIEENRYIVISPMGHVTAMNEQDAMRVGVLEKPRMVDPATGDDLGFSHDLEDLVPLQGGHASVQFMNVTEPGVVVPLEQTTSRRKGGGE